MRPYARPSTRQGVIQLLSTAAPFLGLTAAIIGGLDHGVWAASMLAVPAAAFLVRLFMIQHDCGHGSYFRSRWANDLLGSVLGVLTLTPYAFWRHRHAVHHATSGNLDRRGTGDIATLTVREYVSSPPWRRLVYRLYRHPLILFALGPIYLFLLRYRIPTGSPVREWRSWSSVLGTDAALAGVSVLLAWTVGLGPFLSGYLPVIILAAVAGVWLFYVQHQFEHAYWETGSRWSYHAAALEGSSLYDLPRLLHWLTCHIGFHHIHHLSSKIPNYRLRACFEQNPAFHRVERVSLRQSLRCARLALWDEDLKRLVSFRQVRAQG